MFTVEQCLTKAVELEQRAAEPHAPDIRADFAESVEANSVHGSDSPENAEREIAFFFAETELVG